ncbi:MAG: polymer-forming cytoskeletal protein [Gemmatimonadales bacterium]
MGIFSNPGAEAAAPSVPRRRVEGNALSIVAPDLVVSGDLTADGVIRIEGRVTGNVSAGQQILLSEGGVVEGDMKTREAVLGGEVRGSVTAEERIEVQPTAVVHGDLATPRLLVQEGGRVNGAVRMETGAS